MTESKMVLVNERTRIEYDPENKRIFGRDLKDTNNEPAFFNKSVRGIKKAWKVLEAAFTTETSMYDAAKILWDNGIKIHEWCMMD